MLFRWATLNKLHYFLTPMFLIYKMGLKMSAFLSWQQDLYLFLTYFISHSTYRLTWIESIPDQIEYLVFQMQIESMCSFPEFSSSYFHKHILGTCCTPDTTLE